MPITMPSLFTRGLACCGVLCCFLVDARAEGVDATRPTVPTSRLQITAEGEFAHTTLALTQNDPANWNTITGGVSLGATVYFRPLVDDDSPRALQPFLQRASTFWLQVRGNGVSTLASPGNRGYQDTDKQLGTSLAVDAYVRRFFILTATLGVNLHSFTQKSPGEDPVRTAAIEVLPVAVGAGLRIADTRVDLSYAVFPLMLNLPFASELSASVRTVVRQRVDLSLRGSVIDQGATVTAQVAAYPTRSLGIFGSVFYGHGLLDLNLGDPEVIDRVSGQVGVSYWVTRAVGGSIRYTPTWATNSTTYTQMSHALSVTLDSRL